VVGISAASSKACSGHGFCPFVGPTSSEISPSACGPETEPKGEVSFEGPDRGIPVGPSEVSASEVPRGFSAGTSSSYISSRR
jgi:hypothetical protein